MTVKEAADFLGCSKVTITRWITANKIKATKEKTGLRFSYNVDKKSLIEYAESKGYLTN